MPALSVIDLAMFLLETPERPFNIGPLIVLDPPARGRSTFADRLCARMLKRPVGPPFNYRLRTPRLGVPTLEVDPKAGPAERAEPKVSCEDRSRRLRCMRRRTADAAPSGPR
jgi:hypothetical protein